MSATDAPVRAAAASDADELVARCEQLLASHDPQTVSTSEFLGAQFDAGLAWVSFPVGEGGLGMSASLQPIVDGVLAKRSAPHPHYVNPIGYGMVAPTLAGHGTDNQRAAYLRPLFTGEEIWCQLFSEPGAGSDVASLATRAVMDGDEWLVNGQKVWTTLGHLARRGILIARSDPEQPKHRGMTAFVVDMHSGGVDVRPLMQITGEAEFNEVFLSDVRIPDHDRLGGVGQGWSVALTTLMNERVAIGGRVPMRGAGFIGEALAIWHAIGARSSPARDQLMKLWIRAEALRLTNIRAQQMRAAGNPGPEGSIGKALSADLNREISSLAVELLGPHGMLKPGGYPMERPADPVPWGNAQHAFLRSRANSIEGGTSEIMRNILSERVLGLPPESRPDKNLPWSNVIRA